MNSIISPKRSFKGYALNFALGVARSVGWLLKWILPVACLIAFQHFFMAVAFYFALTGDLVTASVFVMMAFYMKLHDIYLVTKEANYGR